MNAALDELSAIVLITDPIERHSKFSEWKQEWIQPVEKTQLVINKSQMTLDEHDYVCEHIVKLCAEQLIENQCVNYTISNNSYTMDLLALRTRKRSDGN